MPGVVFLVVVPSSKFEREIVQGQYLDNYKHQPEPVGIGGNYPHGVNNLNHPNKKGIIHLEVEIRDKNIVKARRAGKGNRNPGQIRTKIRPNSDEEEGDGIMLSMEKILEELLTKLEIEHVTWSSDKKGNYCHAIFPIQSGEPCETMLHCLTELGIGTKINSCVSVLPCTVSYDGFADNTEQQECRSANAEDLSKWNNFVESIKSKLTVKQVVDGVRAGGSISFDYILLIVTADSLAALGLVENSATNIVAAMLVSPLMGPVMSITFGAIISDKKLMKVGFQALSLGMFISILFGFIFGLILGTTEMPWGSSDWPTEEMRGRGNARSLWMGICWALTSGTGVAVALLQGATGPLIGVAISASLLPPVVNCGLFWALACIWQIYPNIRMPHLKGELNGVNSSYPFIYTNYLPTEFFVNGIVSGLLTVVNVICIFITAIIVLKIKEVASPYTSSPDLRRFWETDIRTVRKTNRSTIRRTDMLKDNILPYTGTGGANKKELETALEQALKEVTEDDTFRKIKRMSYSSNAVGELRERLPFSNSPTADSCPLSSDVIQSSKLKTDLQALDKLVSSLLEQSNQEDTIRARSSTKSRRRTLSRSLTSLMGNRSSMKSQNIEGSKNSYATTSIQQSSLLPTILEQSKSTKTPAPERLSQTSSIRGVINTIANAPHRFSQSMCQDEEHANLTQNILE